MTNFTRYSCVTLNPYKMTTKQKIILLSLAIVGMAFAGCQKAKSLADITIHPSLPADINVTVPAVTGIQSTTGTSISFNDSITVDPTSNSDVSKYSKDIKSWSVDSVSAVFKNVSTPDTLTNVTLKVSNGTDTFNWQTSSIVIDNGTVFALGNSSGQINTLNNILNAKQPFKIIFSGTSDKANVTFTLSVTIKTTMVVNPLGS